MHGDSEGTGSDREGLDGDLRGNCSIVGFDPSALEATNMN